MRVGFFTPYLDSLTGGEKYILTAAACLSKQHKVYIFWNPEKEKEIKKKAQDRFGLELSRIIFYPNIFSEHTPFLKRFLNSFLFDRIIFLSDGSIPFLARKTIIHFQFPTQWVNLTPGIKIKVFRVKKFICNSYFTKNYIDKKFGVNSFVLYPPCETSKTMNLAKKNMILSVGRFGQNKEGSNFKKHDVLINIFKKLVDNGISSWRLVLVVAVRDEDKENFEKLKKSVQGYPIDILKNPNNQVLWQYYSQAKIYWHAAGFGEDLIKHPEKAEHFGISTVEAMSQGAVAIVINGGGQKEIVENYESGFFFNTKEELLERTLLLIKNTKLLSDMSLNAIRRSKIFSKERFCKEITEIIK